MRKDANCKIVFYSGHFIVLFVFFPSQNSLVLQLTRHLVLHVYLCIFNFVKKKFVFVCKERKRCKSEEKYFFYTLLVTDLQSYFFVSFFSFNFMLCFVSFFLVKFMCEKNVSKCFFLNLSSRL